MSDLLMKLNRNPATSRIVKALGLPNPVPLARSLQAYVAAPLAAKTALLARCADGYAGDAIAAALTAAGASCVDTLPAEGQLDIVAVDATACASAADLRLLYDTFHPLMRRIARNGRVVIVAAQPAAASDPVAAASARGIEGFTRSLGKELGKRGVTANLLYLEAGAAERLDGPLRFFCGVQTTYVSGQAVQVSGAVRRPASVPLAPALAGKVALVTGSARGIGMATAERLAQEGAQVICLDVQAAADELHRTTGRIGAIPLILDIGAVDAPQRLASFLRDKFGGVDIVVHNAGITRDRTLANMKEHYWDLVLNVNFAAITAINAVLLSEGVLRDEGRIVCLSSMSGVAGNFGQTNYAASKAALIGYVRALAPQLAARGICVNAIAPGFIETAMTDAMPFITREVGRRLNSLQQGGAPRDAAELVAFLSTPGAYGISGETIRVCGQGLIGA
ncbi:MAG: 3-oxoacyl-ACP reductase [Sphingomonadaceae bacterium]